MLLYKSKLVSFVSVESWEGMELVIMLPVISSLVSPVSADSCNGIELVNLL